ncbi:hypothetical protein KFL_001530120 [Klebsormidium nitens]|uniref:Terpene synthase n=1 Tax=Klebsormidium nitens TaxID=105231 RepID=A0A1Y1HY21_KLENI|nr:hypothetical protein KFL_001530120 [Klebsormidium nitens]|eukprot:GAQ83570.1 hypothetical protein KFL_001530120 [Klebsormidium nitens]
MQYPPCPMLNLFSLAVLKNYIPFPHAARASESLWGRGEGPFSDLEGGLSWLSPDLGTRAQTLRQSRGGTKLFGFMMCFPDSPDSFKAVSDLMLSVFLVDDWIEQQGPDEAEQLAEWWRTIAIQSDAGVAFDAQRAFEALPPSLLADASMRKAGELCCSALTYFLARAARVDPAWFGRFAWAIHEYAKAVASEITAARSFLETGTHPAVVEYFAYRCFSSAFIQLAVLAALQQGLRLSDARFAGARPLLVCASLLACCFNDAFVAAKDAAAGQTNLTKAVGTRCAVDMHNALVDCLCEESERWLEDATEGDDSQRFVDLLKASTFGCNLWHNICPRYRKYLEVTCQPFGVIDGPNGLLSAGNGALKQEMRELVHTLASSESSAPRFSNACEGIHLT